MPRAAKQRWVGVSLLFSGVLIEVSLPGQPRVFQVGGGGVVLAYMALAGSMRAGEVAWAKVRTEGLVCCFTFDSRNRQITMSHLASTAH